MIQAKFTKKMRVGKPTDHAPFCVQGYCNVDGLTFEVCAVWGVDCDSAPCEQSRANAHLIAAAPEMYEMLNDLRRAVSLAGINSADNDAILTAIDNLLAKARGETK